MTEEKMGYTEYLAMCGISENSYNPETGMRLVADREKFYGVFTGGMNTDAYDAFDVGELDESGNDYIPDSFLAEGYNEYLYPGVEDGLAELMEEGQD